MFRDLAFAAAGAGALFAGHFIWLGLKKGWGVVEKRLASLWSGAVNDVKADVATLKTDMAAVKSKVGL